ncbi:hypothetical protein [Catellatospora sp. NPDC049133]|uniref:hypothetical protein n=1 Tax=Catellatospora sp. NPDC049133 TaxID=3155499 RepID=UPI0033F61031
MGEILVLMVLVALIKNAVLDTLALVQRQPNPRLEMRKQKYKERRDSDRYTVWDWAADIASDELEAHTKRRRARRASATPAPDTTPAVTTSRLDQPVRQPQVPLPTAQRVAVPIDADQPQSAQPTPVSAPADAAPDTRNVLHDIHDYCVSPDCPTCKRGAVARPAVPAADQAPAAQPVDTRPLAVVRTHPRFNADTASPEGASMTTEVNGLDQAITYTTALRDEILRHTTAANEQYIGVLTRSKCGGDQLTTAKDMQSKADELADFVTAHLNKLLEQKRVQEAYDQVQGAGDKDFLTSGR